MTKKSKKQHSPSPEPCIQEPFIEQEPPEQEETSSPQTKEVRGMPVSGRFWKEPQRKPTSHLKIPKTVKTKWETRVKARNTHQSIKLRENALKQSKKDQFEKTKKMAKERAARKLENEKKSEVVQIGSSAKVKRMAKRKLLGKGKSGIIKR